MRTTAANYRGGIASLLAGTRALGQGMQDLNTGLYGFTPQGRREAELRRMLDEAMKKRAGMDMAAADAPPPRDPRLAGMPALPMGEGAPPPPLAPPMSASALLAGAPAMPVKPPVAAGMPAAPKPMGLNRSLFEPTAFGGGALPGALPVSPQAIPVLPPPLSEEAQRRKEYEATLPPKDLSALPAGPVGAPGGSGPPGPGGLTPDDQAMLGQTGLGSLLGMPGPKGGSPATTPPRGAAEALTVAKRDPFAAGPLAAPPSADPFGGERKGLLLDRAIATLQKNPGQASAMTDRLLGRAQEDSPEAIRSDIEVLSGLDGSPEAYRSAMPQMRSNLGRKELFGMITEGINRKRTEEAEGRKFGQQKELEGIRQSAETGRTKMQIEGQKDVATTRAASMLESNLARVVAAKQKAEGKPVLSAQAYLTMERQLLKDAESNAQAAYATMADSRGMPKEGFTDEQVKMARDAWMGAQTAQAQWSAQAAMRRWEKDYVKASGAPASGPAVTGPVAVGAEPQTAEEWAKYLSEVPEAEFDAAEARYNAWKASQE